MIAWLVSAALKVASSGLIDKVVAALKAEADSTTERQKITAEVAIEQIRAELGRRQAQRDVLLAEQGHWLTRMMRPAFAYPLAVFYGAVILDSVVIHAHFVQALPAPIGDWSGWIISAIFLSDSGERITRTIVGRRPG